MTGSSRFKYVPPAIYDGWYDTPRGRWVEEREYRLLADSLGPEKGDSILDIGCGTGRFTRRLANGTGAQVTGVDVNAEWLAYARSRDAFSRYLLADAMALPFEDRSFTHVCSVTALCFTPNWRKAVAEALRVARERFAIGLLNRHSLLWLTKGRQKKSAYQGADWITEAELADSVKELPVCGLEFRTAICLPSGSWVARFVEDVLPPCLKPGSFLLMSGKIREHGSEVAPS
ncbi:class I SAM-dependent methyltransferase [Oxalobacter paraformigenes]|uniref:class I SAM-dependent methyltransferase n=1 Tax=Oxalobacter paraformigenes TaxID=556268 RepID=UPI001E5633F8|nr:class I SAM-dependent methyltransferase [Oxalobacter paraformigenes]